MTGRHGGLTVGELYAELAELIKMGGADDLVYVVTHENEAPLMRTEPGDGLEDLFLIGWEDHE